MAAPSSSSSSSDPSPLSTPPNIDMNEETGKTPTVTLDSDEISHDMAARLTIALLGQMLYMKGQVPFPVASLTRIAERWTGENTSRAAVRGARKRIEFLQSYDDLTSHLHTTFVALSTALALNTSKHPSLPPSMLSPNASPNSGIRRRPAKVHVLLILGPSPSAAKARLLLELDGFHVERFGENDCLRHDEHESEHESEDETLGDEAEINPATPSWRAHSPLPHASPRTPPQSPGSPFASSSRGSYSSGDSVPSSPQSSEREASLSSLANASFSSCGRANALLLAQRAEHAALRAGERLLSRALFVGGESLGLGDEILPTQAHILIRAPRRLVHPTWVPRQTLGHMLDKQVQRFLDSESASNRTGGERRKGGFGVGLRTVGVRVQCRSRVTEDTTGAGTHREGVGEGKEGGEEDDEEDDDKDEMIWWSWDGKLVGFSD